MQVVKEIISSESIGVSFNSQEKLLVVRNLFEALHENDISYCNLKGNDQHLIISLTGKSDIDILFDKDQKEKLERLLQTLGFKKFEAIKEKRYKDIVDFMALDSQSGKVIHLHTYYGLTIGEPFLKGYQLDIVNRILSTRAYNEEFGTYCIRPAYELTLLYVIESLKLRRRDWFTTYFKNKISFSEKAIYEHDWLWKKANQAEVEVILRSLFKDHEEIYHLMKGEFNRKQLHKLAPLIRKEFARFRLYPRLGGMLLRWYREAAVTFRKLSRLLAQPVVSLRVNPRGGKIVALTGANSALNAAIANQLRETFGKKLDVYNVNFRIHAEGKPPKPKDSADHRINRNGEQVKNDGAWNRLLQEGAGSLDGLKSHHKERKLLKLALKVKSKGALVICNSTPCAPDLIFKVVPNHAGGIKTERPKSMAEDVQGEMTTVTQQSGAGFNCKTVIVDSRRPLSEVLFVVKNEIWNIL